MKALLNLDLDNLLFIDIETTSTTPLLTKEDPMWDSWNYKMKYGREPIGGEDAVATYAAQASLYAEFGKIACITIGKIQSAVLKVKSYAGRDEKELLTNFCNALNGICNANKKTVFAGHAIKGFDIPWMMRRCIVNQIELPKLIDIGHLKPWEVDCVDTMDLWKGSAFNGASLIAIAVALGLHNPKDELSGYQCSETYWNDTDGIAKIAKYCEKDVLTVANIVRKCRYEPIVTLGEPIEAAKPVPLLDKLFAGGKYSIKDARILTDIYIGLTDKEKANMALVLKSIIDKNTSFTQKHLDAIINFKPKTK